MAWLKSNWVNIVVDEPIVFDDINDLGNDLDDAFDAVDTVHDIAGATNKHKDPMVARIVARVNWNGSAYAVTWQEADFQGLTIAVAKSGVDDSCDVTISGSGMDSSDYLPVVVPLSPEEQRIGVNVTSPTAFNVSFHNGTSITGLSFGLFLVSQGYA